MKADLKARWVEALRSGKYEQAKGALRDITSNGRCCLGVYCDVVDPEGWTPKADEEGCIHWWEHRLRGFGNYLDQRAVGLPNNIQKKLARLNDSGKSFSEIADEIERLVPGEG